MRPLPKDLDVYLSKTNFRVEKYNLRNVEKRIDIPAIGRNLVKKRAVKTHIFSYIKAALETAVSKPEDITPFMQNLMITRVIDVTDTGDIFIFYPLLRYLCKNPGAMKVKAQENRFHREELDHLKSMNDTYGFDRLYSMRKDFFEDIVQETNYVDSPTSEGWHHLEMNSNTCHFSAILLSDVYIDREDLIQKAGFCRHTAADKILPDLITSASIPSVLLCFRNNPVLNGKWCFTKTGMAFETKEMAMLFKLMYQEIPSSEDQDFIDCTAVPPPDDRWDSVLIVY